MYTVYTARDGSIFFIYIPKTGSMIPHYRTSIIGLSSDRHHVICCIFPLQDLCQRKVWHGVCNIPMGQGRYAISMPTVRLARNLQYIKLWSLSHNPTWQKKSHPCGWPFSILWKPYQAVTTIRPSSKVTVAVSPLERPSRETGRRINSSISPTFCTL